MPRPTTRSGHALRMKTVTRPAAMMAMLAIASLRAEKGRAAEAAVMRPVAGERERAGEVHRQRAEPGDRQRLGRRRDRDHELAPGHPERRRSRDQQQPCQHRAHLPAPLLAPAERHDDQEVHRRVFQEVDRVGEQRDAADAERHGELHPEIREVGERDEKGDAAKSDHAARFRAHAWQESSLAAPLRLHKPPSRPICAAGQLQEAAVVVTAGGPARPPRGVTGFEA